VRRQTKCRRLRKIRRPQIDGVKAEIPLEEDSLIRSCASVAGDGEIIDKRTRGGSYRIADKKELQRQRGGMREQTFKTRDL
jgi:hypothetical protein